MRNVRIHRRHLVILAATLPAIARGGLTVWHDDMLGMPSKSYAASPLDVANILTELAGVPCLPITDSEVAAASAVPPMELAPLVYELRQCVEFPGRMDTVQCAAVSALAGALLREVAAEAGHVLTMPGDRAIKGGTN